MSREAIDNFFKALDGVRCLFCVQCKQLCKNPVILSKCFHTICSEHFDSLIVCPRCRVSLDDCVVWSDYKMRIAVDAIEQLYKLLEPFCEINPPHPDTSSVDYVMLRDIKFKSSTSSASQVAEASSLSSSEWIGHGSKSFDTSIDSLTFSPCKANKTFVKKNKKGETRLHIACRLGMLDKVTKMLSDGVDIDINTMDYAGWTPLHEAVQNNHLDLVELLLRNHALVNVPGKGNETALHGAVRLNFVDIAKELVNYGADINARNSKGDTPLDLASAEMKVILKKVAHVERQMD